MKRTSLEEVRCSIARTVDVIGEWWTPLILRDLFLGVTKFEDIRTDLGIATNVLSDRLETLVERDIVERHRYHDKPPRYAYALTPKGQDLYPVLLALTRWGDRWMTPAEGPPALMFHNDCGQQVNPLVVCDGCGGELTSENVTVQSGPGGRAGPGTQIIGALLAHRDTVP